MKKSTPNSWVLILIAGITTANSSLTDSVTDWNLALRSLVVESELNTPVSNRMMAIVHTAMFVAANGVSKQYPPSEELNVDTVVGASLDAAIAGAARYALLDVLPAQEAKIEQQYALALERLTARAGLASGLQVGERAANAVLALRRSDGHDASESYRPTTSAGRYVPTTIPAVPQWPSR